MTSPSWFLVERAHAGPEHLDPEYVSRYDRKAAFDPSADVQRLVAHGLDENGTVVDLGYGTGAFALAVAAHCRRVVAVDVSPAMVGALQATLKRSGVDNVEPVLAGF